MYAGTFVETGSVDQVFAGAPASVTFGLLRSVPRLDAGAAAGAAADRGLAAEHAEPAGLVPVRVPGVRSHRGLHRGAAQLEPVEPSHRISLLNPVAADEWQRQLEGVA